MKQHTIDFKNEIKLLGKQQSVRITYTLNDEQITITDEEINSATPIFSANLLKSVMKEVHLDSNLNIPEDTEIKFEYGLLVNGQYEYLDYGNYIVYSTKKKEDTSSYEIKCYDKLLYSMKTYEAVNVTYPCTIKEYLTALSTKIGLSIKEDLSFSNMNQVLDSDLYENLDYTYRDVLDQIAQVSGGIICLTLDDKVEVKYINETNDVIDEEYINSTNVTFGEKYGPINSIVLSRSGESDNIYLSDEQSIEENGLCEIKIIDNQIMNFNDRDKFLQELSERLFGVEYYLNDFESTGVMYYDILDAYNVKIGENIYNCLMLNDEQLISQGLAENIYTERPEQSETDYTKADKTDQRINQAYIIVDKQNKKIESLTSEVDQYSERISTVEQTVDGISQKVESIEEFAREIKSMQQLHLTDTAEGENLILNLTIYGDTNKFKVLTPEIDLVPSESLVPYGDTIDLIVDTQPRTNPSENLKTFEIDIGEPLRNVGQVRDELNIINNKVTIIRRISNDLQVLDNEIIEELGKIIIPTYKYDTYIYIREYPTLEYFCRYIIDNDYLDTFATQENLENAVVELNSSITQTAKEINAEVSQKVGEKEIIAKINISPETIKILANKLAITANDVLNIISGNTLNLTAKDINIKSNEFNVDKYGKVTCSDIEITGGIINLGGASYYSPKFKTSGIGLGGFSGDTIVYPDGLRTKVNGQTLINLSIGSLNDQPSGGLSVSDYTGSTSIHPNQIITPKLIQTSKEEKKKNIALYNENVIEKIKNSKIYEYNLNFEEDIDKKHIGFIIGNKDGKYKTPNEVISGDREGIDLYTMCSILWKAVQEQQEQIECLKTELEKNVK